MDWATIAILGTIALGMVNVLDSHLIVRRMPSLRAYLIPVSLVILVFSLTTFYLFPLPEGVGAWPLTVAVFSGILRTASVAILLYVLKTEEVSWAVPLFYTYPVFVSVMAVPLLGEMLGYLQWLAIVIVVAGAVIVSKGQSPSGSVFRLGKPFFLLLGASLMMAVADVASKYALEYITFWNMYWIASLSLSVIFLLFALRPGVVKELVNMPRPGTAMALITVNETLAMAGIVLVFWAMESGPVSLVATIAGSRPIFVFFLAVALNRILPDFLLEARSSRGALAVRLAATAMIAGGIAIIYLAG